MGYSKYQSSRKSSRKVDGKGKRRRGDADFPQSVFLQTWSRTELTPYSLLVRSTAMLVPYPMLVDSSSIINLTIRGHQSLTLLQLTAFCFRSTVSHYPA
ncbi:hypothetical protein TNCV_3152211 [Trichonephila clavipes]|nr:hypothetical protein TNCV_3152211 [Trichonephila clavipes]